MLQGSSIILVYTQEQLYVYKMLQQTITGNNYNQCANYIAESVRMTGYHIICKTASTVCSLGVISVTCLILVTWQAQHNQLLTPICQR